MLTRDLFHRLPPDARVLLIRLRSMGDCLLLTSPVRALKSEFPGFRVSVLVDERFADCFHGNPDVDRVLAVRNKAATMAHLVAQRFELIVNLHGGPTSTLLALSARGRRVAATHHQYHQLYTGTYPKPDGALHTAQSTLRTFHWMGVSAQTAPPLRFERDADAAVRIRTRLRETAGFDAGRAYVVVHPAAVMDTKRWPASRFADLIAWLREQEHQVVLTCGPGEETLVNELRHAAPGAHALTGLSIPELAELIRGGRLYIGNDSGPMHLATAVGTPTVAIWGSSSSVRWHPWGVEHRVVQNPFVCNPCPGYRCLVAASPLCIESITVEQVKNAVRALIGQPA